MLIYHRGLLHSRDSVASWLSQWWTSLYKIRQICDKRNDQSTVARVPLTIV